MKERDFFPESENSKKLQGIFAQAGYVPFRNFKREISFIRPENGLLGKDPSRSFPRYHLIVCINEEGEMEKLSLHWEEGNPQVHRAESFSLRVSDELERIDTSLQRFGPGEVLVCLQTRVRGARLFQVAEERAKFASKTKLKVPRARRTKKKRGKQDWEELEEVNFRVF